ncbi:MAG: RNA-binding transcriptional accessory protein, partial [Chloroflexi bacterium]|nr:RNA-binding transcriptional accessory protein [Chloroflexota bacterium]
MDESQAQRIETRLNIEAGRVRATVALLEEGATVPFIARYRKEATGTLDEVAVMAIRDLLAELVELDSRKDAILKSLDERELLTESLHKKIQSAETMTSLEDIYLPFRPKRRTRATIARERGLEPLAEIIWAQDDVDLHAEAENYVDERHEVMNVSDALSGARDIIAERVSEDGTARARLRALFEKF